MKHDRITNFCRDMFNFPDSRIGASLKLAGDEREVGSMGTSPIRESGPH